MSHPRHIYFAGALFCAKDLIGNALLAEAIHKTSEGRFLCRLPQNYELRETTSAAIRDQDLLLLLNCDIGIFHFDGTELDSGTVVEYLFAKFIDMPAVIIRSDFRAAGDAKNVPWNLMVSNFPRTEYVLLDAMQEYQDCLKAEMNSLHSVQDGQEDLRETSGKAAQASYGFSEKIAKKLVLAMENVCAQAPILQAQEQREIFSWAVRMCGPSFEKVMSQQNVQNILARREAP